MTLEFPSKRRFWLLKSHCRSNCKKDDWNVAVIKINIKYAGGSAKPKLSVSSVLVEKAL